jgi:hypothetical protein
VLAAHRFPFGNKRSNCYGGAEHWIITNFPKMSIGLIGGVDRRH